MANYIAIQKSIHKDAGYAPTTSFGYASHMATVPLLKEELAQASQFMAIAFQAFNTGTPNECFELVGVQSIAPNRNLFVTPDGRWLTGYKPAFYRSHPFALITNPETKEMEINIDKENVIDEPGDNDSRFFDEEGNLTEQMRKVAEFLGQSLRSRGQTLELCRELQEAGLIAPWSIPFTHTTENGEKQQRSLQGLSRIDPNALKKLDSEILTKLCRSGALDIAYAQLLAEPRAAGLSTLASVHSKMDEQQAQAKATPEVDLETMFNDDDELFSF